MHFLTEVFELEKTYWLNQTKWKGLLFFIFSQKMTKGKITTVHPIWVDYVNYYDKQYLNKYH